MQETQHTQQTATRPAQKSRQENNMNVNGYKNTEDTQEQTNKEKKGVPPWNGQ